MRAEHEILAYNDHPCSEPVEEFALHELLRGEGCQILVESQDIDFVRTRGAKQFDAAIDRRQRLRRSGRSQYGSRMWPERDGDEGQSCAVGFDTGLRDE
jgi:hypothetical protein